MFLVYKDEHVMQKV